MSDRTYSFDEEAPPNDPTEPKFIYSRSISAAVYLAHRFSVVALILVVLWAMFHDTSSGYLGGLGWSYPNVFNWHPVMMVAGMVICSTEAILAFRAFPFDKLINRRVRYLWHVAGITFIIIGLIAVFTYRNDKNEANLWSLHSWLGVMTISLFLAQFALGSYLFFNEAADPDMREAYIPFFAWLDIFVFVSACFTAEAGIVEKTTMLGCTYNISTYHHYDKADPAEYYDDLPTGCRISEGLGIVILVLCVCTVYAALELKLPDLTGTAAGWEAYRLTPDQLAKRREGVAWYHYVCPCLPTRRAKKKRRRSDEEKLMKPRRRSSLARDAASARKSNWVEKNDGSGGTYYYNTKTQQSTTERPNEL